MNSLPFHYKHRPQVFSDMVGIDYLSKQLSSIVRNKKFNALLFNGLNGHGKTTLAEIYLRRFFCESPIGLDACLTCNSCQITGGQQFCYDIYRTSGESLKIDTISYLKRFCDYSPRVLKKQTLFIDDLDLADRNIIEMIKPIIDENYENLLLLLTVTNLQAMPLPLTQRCKVLPVRKADYSSLEILIRRVCKQEGIPIEESDAVQNLITLSFQTPRVILTTLEIIKDEEAGLSNEILQSPVIESNLQLLTGKFMAS